MILTPKTLLCLIMKNLYTRDSTHIETDLEKHILIRNYETKSEVG